MYYSYIKYKIDILEINIESYKAELEPVSEVLENNKKYLKRHLDYIDLLNGKVKSLPEPILSVANNHIKYLNIQIKIYYTLYNKINKIREEIKHLVKLKLKYVYYLNLMSIVNLLILEQIIVNKKSFYFKGVGTLSVKAVNNKKKRINWGASNKKRKEIEEQGLIPFSKDDYLKAKEEGKEYNGIDWYVFHPSLDLFYKLKFSAKHKETYPILKDYIFKPTRGSNSATYYLNEYKKTLTKKQIKEYL